ncbi:tripartite tricarboxylate transporter substrate binding protein [Bradyrhizobium sp. AUGA SZCCT0158]|jgi:tripartite-type tricarboxylate transporter receptor subunit TctC|uniref:Bug family tripartite tricarboxylate transporter substrate binding protein n=1 Tax=unclassified Bradyrhizobium TaxID=2631580 RepID=UPI001BA5A8A6|nr:MULTISPECIES: tripartite tricarboxylate transporter substrate binding protein [unclassified Bradyrhizobium]MBR1190095.1 tripartite tricarboxylate transporter substrate binding protein [Bradyrhizobium sp. AUGA SZCCT0160]MBR1197729.1 tripartite tricarboxylate transporter substrate binding protein [Bradyrhizobium sp. AUGA SZCCT0158]
MTSGKLVRGKARALGVVVLVAMALVATVLGAKAQPYPSRSLTILVGYSAGGQADALARIIGKQLGENLKVSVVIENKTGANGMIAAQAAARAEPDGYTILLVTDAMVAIDPHLATSNHFDLSKAMEPVVNVMWSPLLLAAANNVPANSVAELVALGKQKTQNLSFGSPGSSTPHRLAGEMLQKYGGFTMTHIPYKGTSVAVNDLLGGQIPLLFGAPTAVEPLAMAGKIKVLGVTSEKRFPLLPDVPAISETFPEFKVISYTGFMLPKNTPKAVIATLNKEINQILATESMRTWLDKQRMVALGGTPDDFRRQIEVDYQARGELIRALGITAE